MISVNRMTLKEIEIYIKNGGCIDKDFFEQLGKDSRVGARNLLERLAKEKQAADAERNRILNLLYHERELYKKNVFPVAGIDEAGRGPLAGPVFAAAVVLPLSFEIEGVKDSKKLSSNARKNIVLKIKDNAICWSVDYCSSKIIDYYNILEATKIAALKAITRLPLTPHHILLDAFSLKMLSCEQTSLVKGEEKSISIAAASILAKVSRDEYMNELAKKYPHFKFEKNKGYPTKEHFDLLETFGPCPEHRISFL